MALIQLVGNARVDIHRMLNRWDSERRAKEQEAERVRNMEEALSLILKADVIPLPYRKMALKALGKDPVCR